MTKQICPLLLPVTELDLQDHTLQKRQEVEEAIRKENADIKLLHSQLGLVYELYPTPKVDDKEVLQMTAE